jgi:lysophospholipase L1-like esterase
MKRIFLGIYWVIYLSGIQAQPGQFKFDFGASRTVKGWIVVTPETKFDPATGYGFDRGSEPLAVDRQGDALRGDFITSHKPFSFSVILPEGNYDVKLTLGDRSGISATTVRVECRRLMLENIRTKMGEIRAETFTVHVRDSLIRKNNSQTPQSVRLKPREINYLHWDNLLTIEFNDSIPKVAAIEILPNKKATTIFLAGNSTVVDQDREPWAAWGQMFPRFLVPSKVAVANYAESGETLLAFKGEGRLEKIWSLARPGDYLFIEFAHNDQKPGRSHLDAFTEYKQTLMEWIAEAKRRKVVPVLVTSMHRRNFDSLGHIINTLLDYPEAMRQVTKEEDIYLLDLNAMSKSLYEAWGVEGSLKAFVHYPANSFPGQKDALKDNTHFSPYGAYELAKCIITGIRATGLPLVAFLKKEWLKYDPSEPLPFEKFYWPPSSFRELTKPNAN